MLLQPFLEQCRARPAAVALVEGDRTLGYGALLAQVQGIAAALAARGAGPGSRVALLLERGSLAVAAAFGVLMTGACYVPIDPRNPPARRDRILGDADVVAILGTSPAPDGWDRLWLEAETCAAAPFDPVLPDRTALAAILYTSGSTGQPKGVALSHGAIAAFAHWAADLLALMPGERIASSTPLSFDLSTFDLFAVLGRGAHLDFIPAGLFMAPAQLADWLRGRAVAGWYTVPSLLAFLVYKGGLAAAPLVRLRFLVFAGEVFPTPALQSLAAALPETRLYNFYGPTETNVCCYWPVDRARLASGEPIPIGFPAADDRLHGDPVSGELWVQGPTLLSGYWQSGRLQPALSAIGGAGPMPSSAEASAAWYATGDRVSRNAAGEWLFHGRLSRMLKCSGYRVEPAEIEAALLALPGVRAAAVVGLADPAAGQRPAAVLVLESGMTVAAARNALKSRLPAYMLPSRYAVVDALPLLANGKVDCGRVREVLEGVMA